MSKLDEMKPIVTEGFQGLRYPWPEEREEPKREVKLPSPDKNVCEAESEGKIQDEMRKNL